MRTDAERAPRPQRSRSTEGSNGGGGAVAASGRRWRPVSRAAVCRPRSTRDAAARPAAVSVPWRTAGAAAVVAAAGGDASTAGTALRSSDSPATRIPSGPSCCRPEGIATAAMSASLPWRRPTLDYGGSTWNGCADRVASGAGASGRSGLARCCCCCFRCPGSTALLERQSSQLPSGSKVHVTYILFGVIVQNKLKFSNDRFYTIQNTIK